MAAVAQHAQQRNLRCGNNKNVNFDSQVVRDQWLDTFDVLHHICNKVTIGDSKSSSTGLALEHS